MYGHRDYTSTNMEMWIDYIKEREGKDVVLLLHKGFAVYKINDDKTCYLEHIYVAPAHRGQKVASELCDTVAARAKEAGCIRLLGSVLPGAPGDSHSLKVQLAHGFKLDGVLGNLIILSKDL